MKFKNKMIKKDGSFIIMVNNMPYNTYKSDKYYEKTLELYNNNPDEFVEYVEEVAVEPTYKEMRAASYASVPDQLDMIYHDKVDGTSKWIEHIEYVKNKHPKTTTKKKK